MSKQQANATYPPDRRWPWPVTEDYPEPYPSLLDTGQEVVPCVGALSGRCCGERHDGACAERVEYVVRWDCGGWDEECLRCDKHLAADRASGNDIRSIRTFAGVPA